MTICTQVQLWNNMYCLMLGCRYHYFSKFVKYAYPWCPFFHTSNANSCIYIFLVSFGVHGVCKSCISFWGVFHSLFSFFFLFFSCLNEFFFFLGLGLDGSSFLMIKKPVCIILCQQALFLNRRGAYNYCCIHVCPFFQVGYLFSFVFDFVYHFLGAAVTFQIQKSQKCIFATGTLWHFVLLLQI